MAEGVTVANAFVQVMPSMEGATSNITNALVPSLGSAGDKAGAQFGSVFAGKAGTLLKAAGGALAGVFAVGAMKDAFTTVEAGFNNVKLATGATGEQAERLKAVYLEVSKSVSGSFEDIGAAVGELNTRLGLEGKDLEVATEQMMKYAKVTGQDATKATKDVASMMRNVGIPASEMGATLDKFTVAGQKAGIDVASLANNVTKYNAVMKEMGFSTDEQIALMAQFELSGADTASVLNSMKKGVAQWAKEGKDAGAEFKKFVQGVQDGSVTAGDAVEIFGTKGGLSMYEAAQKGQLNFDEMYKVITKDSEGALDSVYQSTLTAQEKFDILGKNLQAGFFQIIEPLLDAIMPYVDSALAGVTDIVNGVVSAIVPFIEQFSAMVTPIIDETLPHLQLIFQQVMTVIGNIIGTVWPSISNTITTVMTVVKNLIAEAWPFIESVVTEATDAIGAFIKQVWPIIQRTIQSAMNVISPLIKTAWPIIKNTITTVMDSIRSVIETVWPIVTGVVEGAIDAIDSAIRSLEPIVKFVSGIFDDVRDAIEDPIEAAKNTIKGIINTIERLFSGMSIDIPSFQLPSIDWHWESIGGILDIPVFDGISWFAKGGFADEATLAGYGEKGLELYWPGYSPYFEKYAKGIAEHMPAGTGGVDIHDCTFNVRSESDIRRVAVELNALINRQTAGAIA